MNKILRKIRKIFYLNQIRPGPRFGRLPSNLSKLNIFKNSITIWFNKNSSLKAMKREAAIKKLSRTKKLEMIQNGLKEKRD